MKFGPIPVVQAAGALLAHAVKAGGRRLPKAHQLTSEDVALLQEVGIGEVVAAVLEPGDVDENESASRLASSIRAIGVHAKPAATGRVNLHATAAGLFTVERSVVDAVNAVDPSITLATLADKVTVTADQMVATIKIIPFATNGALVEQAAALLAGGQAMAVRAFTAKKIALIQTVLDGTKGSVLDKTARTTEGRLARSGSTVVSETRPAHSAEVVAEALSRDLAKADIAIIFGASAMSDFDDVVPAAIRLAGGDVLRAGMPVDPGNLLVLGRIGTKTVMGAPGCARSPKENGFDWVLDRLLAGVQVTGNDIAGMGVGGLLMEIPTRPRPREAAHEQAISAAVDIVILAAGRSTRMGGPNKLMASFDGLPLIRRVAEQALAARALRVTVVLGHQPERIRHALAGLLIRFAENPDYASGLAGSLRVGVQAVSADAAGAMIVLGDMPGMTTADLDRLIAGFSASGGAQIVRASHDGKRGNPVILPRAVFPAVSRLTGDTGARQLVEASGLGIIDVEIGEGATLDVDTAQAMQDAGGVLEG